MYFSKLLPNQTKTEVKHILGDVYAITFYLPDGQGFIDLKAESKILKNILNDVIVQLEKEIYIKEMRLKDEKPVPEPLRN